MFGYLEHIFRRKETEVENADPSVDLHFPLEWGGWGEVPIRRNGFDIGLGHLERLQQSLLGREK